MPGVATGLCVCVFVRETDRETDREMPIIYSFIIIMIAKFIRCLSSSSHCAKCLKGTISFNSLNKILRGQFSEYPHHTDQGLSLGEVERLPQGPTE